MSVATVETAREGPQARILVVDDEADVAMMVADGLRQADPSWYVVSETDPKAAVGRAVEEPFDCVVTDLVMPQMGGLELARQVRAHREDVALLAISGHGDLAASIEALRLGFADFLQKPFDLEDLGRAVRRTLRQRRSRLTAGERVAQLAQTSARLEAERTQLDQKLEIASHDLVLSSKRMARQLDEVARTADVARALMGVIELEDLLGLCAELVGDGAESRTSSIALYEPSEAAVGLLVRAYPDGADSPPALCWLRTPIRTGILCRAAQSRRTVHVESVGDSVLVDPQEKDLWPEGQLLAVPIVFQEAAVAVAVLHRMPGEPKFTSHDIKRASALVKIMGPAILTAKVHHRQRCQTYAALEAVAEGVEERDPFRRGHGSRVQAYAQPVGEALGLPQREVGALQIASRLHDIGHVVVPESAVCHAGPLTEDQWRLVRRHPEAGERFLKPLDFFGEVGAIIRAHHESYDGTGYPDGKAGTEIPPVARIIAVADAFDAMTSPRPHRPPLAAREAVEKLSSLSGQQFDPEAVEAFVGLSPALLENIQAAFR
jgi:response regulator RpfG family c-di-GMP phosphodiesterase